ncbi:glycosyltransferase [Blastococcus montanus]|uniref:glycosyltransferase n=1 Tax=Blastococcus montanus TaxID=3144973 RepID=UPI00320A9C2F
MIAKFVPWPPNSGDKRRTLGIVRALAEHGEVTVCAFAGPDEDATPLEAEGIRVRQLPRRGNFLRHLLGFLQSGSITAGRFWDPRLAAVVRDAVGAEETVLIVEHVQLFPYAKRVKAAATVLDMHNIESSLTGRLARAQRGVRRIALHFEARALRRLERTAVRAVNAVAVVSDVDELLLRNVVRHPHVLVVPNAWEKPEPLPHGRDPIVSFVALMSWAPNVDAATWFCAHVWPRVRRQVPDAQLWLVGRNPSAVLRALADESVTVTGTVPDLAPYYERTRVAIAPLRAGGGSRLKILEALAAGRPVVATTVGAEGLEDLIGRGVTVADAPKDMADAIVLRLREPDIGAAEGNAGARAVAEDHSWSAATRPLIGFLERK